MMFVAERCMTMGNVHVFPVGSLSKSLKNRVSSIFENVPK